MKKKLASLTIVLGLLATVVGHAARIASPVDQYMAVCTETKEHGGQEYVLTSWLNTKLEADEAGKAHERATRGHRWTIKTRQQPASSAAVDMSQVSLPATGTHSNSAMNATCEGNACDVISLTWDQGVQKYLVQNNSNRRVKVELRNWATTNTIPLGPGESKHSFVSGFINPYRANYE